MADAPSIRRDGADGPRLALERAVGPALAPRLTEVSWTVRPSGFEASGSDGEALTSLDALRVACGGRPAWRPSAIGGVPVPERERIVEQRLDEGRTTAAIAAELGVSDRTVTTLRRQVRERAEETGVHVESKGISVVGPSGLTRDVVHACVAAGRHDVNPGRTAMADDRLRVLVSPTDRELSASHGVAAVVVGLLPDGAVVERAVRGGMAGHATIDAGPDRWLRVISAVDGGSVMLDDSTVASLVHQLREVADVRELTSRELDVVDGIRRGESTKQTARRLALTAKTIENRRHQLYRRFGVRTARQLITLVDRRNIEQRIEA